MQLNLMLFKVISFSSLFLFITACSNPATYPSTPAEPAKPVELIQDALTIAPPEACEDELGEREQLIFNQLALAIDWHAEGRYSSAMEAYEAVLADDFSIKSNAYALWGIISLRLDRNNQDYDRDAAALVFNVLQKRLLEYRQNYDYSRAVNRFRYKPPCRITTAYLQR